MKRLSRSFHHRGFVICPYSCRNASSIDWATLMQKAGLNTLGIHNGGGLHNTRPWRRVLNAMVASGSGHHLIQRCLDSDLDIEYELHAMSSMLPRRHFTRHPEWFIYHLKQKKRIPDYNLCPHAPMALEKVGRQAARLASRYPPTTGRYFLWQDDGGQNWCRCPPCRPYSDSDQLLIVMNAIIGALRRNRPQARLAYLAYCNTIDGPTIIRPAPGIFLEFAPYQRCFLHSVNDQRCRTNMEIWAKLLHLMTIFSAEETHILEYWLDQIFLQCRKDYIFPIMKQDLKAYASLGIRRVTSFATFDANKPLNPTHVRDIMRYGECIDNYTRR